MKYIKSYKLYESVSGELPDILLEINDESLWKAQCWSDSQSQKWVVVIQTVDEDDEYELEGQTPPPSVIETIERAIEFMNGEGFTNYQITCEDMEYQKTDDITLDDISGLDIWPSNFIKIEFWK